MSFQLLDSLLTISALFQRDMVRYFSGSGLTESRVGVLWVLQTGGPCTQQAIASALGVSGRNVSGLVDALESDGFVRRVPHPKDRRAVLVELTPRSSEFMSSMQREHDRLNAALLAAVVPDDLSAFERGIGAVADCLREIVLAAEAGAGLGTKKER
jgi:DNA-binding MarR family transcriptional regulator